VSSERLRADSAAELVATVPSSLLVNVLVHLCGLLAFEVLGVGLVAAGVLPAVGETARHLVFGLVLGALYPRLVRPRHFQGGNPPGLLSAGDPAVVPSAA
jgi:hypothetical protein